MIENLVKDAVFEALDNAVENGYEIEDDFDEAVQMLDDLAELGLILKIAGVPPGFNRPDHVAIVSRFIREWKKEKNS